jgi:type II secretory pathway predicted ATPase ExeA
MYLSHFGLNEAPFRITPHTDFFFDGANRGATLEALVYAITHDEGIVKVSGEVGSGKTMLCRVLMERLPKNVEIIYLSNPSLSRDEILLAIADELKVNVSANRTAVVLRALQEHLITEYAEGHQVVVLIDEAHAMPRETLEEIRLLSNLESSRHKLLQIVLFGQPELDDNLNIPQMRQLKERITHNFRLQPLIRDDIAQYLIFRMRAAGYRGPDIFSQGAIRAIAKASLGLTRRVNILADKSLLAAFSQNTHQITAKHVKAAVRDSEFRPARRRTGVFWIVAGGVAAGIAIGFGLRFIEPAAPTSPAKEIRSTISTPKTVPVPASSAAPPAAPSVQPAAMAPVTAAPATTPAPSQQDPAAAAQVTASGLGASAANAAPQPPANAATKAAVGTVSRASGPAATDHAKAAASSAAPVAAPAAPPAAAPAPPATATAPPVAAKPPAKTAATSGKVASTERSQSQSSTSRTTPNTLSAGVAPKAAGPLTRARMIATETWLADHRESAFAIQVMAVVAGNERELEAFLQRVNKLAGNDNVYVYETRIKGQSKTGLAVVYGGFASRDKVREAIAGFPADIRVHRPYIRTLQGIRREILERDAGRSTN